MIWSRDTSSNNLDNLLACFHLVSQVVWMLTFVNMSWHSLIGSFEGEAAVGFIWSFLPLLCSRRTDHHLCCLKMITSVMITTSPLWQTNQNHSNQWSPHRGKIRLLHNWSGWPLTSTLKNAIRDPCESDLISEKGKSTVGFVGEAVKNVLADFAR